jgi:hypothetical protein
MKKGLLVMNCRNWIVGRRRGVAKRVGGACPARTNENDGALENGFTRRGYRQDKFKTNG